LGIRKTAYPFYTISQYKYTRSTCSFSPMLLQNSGPIAMAMQPLFCIASIKNSYASSGAFVSRNGIS
jgi:hypothetical protein